MNEKKIGGKKKLHARSSVLVSRSLGGLRYAFHIYASLSPYLGLAGKF
jgi:hypothetical protein